MSTCQGRGASRQCRRLILRIKAWVVREDVLKHHPHGRAAVAAATRTLCNVEWLTTVYSR